MENNKTVTINTTQKKLIDMLIGFTNEILLAPLPTKKDNIWIEESFLCGNGETTMHLGLTWAISKKVRKF